MLAWQCVHGFIVYQLQQAGWLVCWGGFSSGHIVPVACASGLCQWLVPVACASGLCQWLVPVACASGLCKWLVNFQEINDSLCGTHDL